MCVRIATDSDKSLIKKTKIVQFSSMSPSLSQKTHSFTNFLWRSSLIFCPKIYFFWVCAWFLFCIRLAKQHLQLSLSRHLLKFTEIDGRIHWDREHILRWVSCTSTHICTAVCFVLYTIVQLQWSSNNITENILAQEMTTFTLIYRGWFLISEIKIIISDQSPILKSL